MSQTDESHPLNLCSPLDSVRHTKNRRRSVVRTVLASTVLPGSGGPSAEGSRAATTYIGGMHLLLVRHGRTAANVDFLLDTAHPGSPLDAQGLAQAQALVTRLAGEPIEAIFTSDHTRARQTAAPLAASRGLSAVLHPGLREVQAGDLEMGVDWVPYVEVLAAWHHDATVRMPGSESGVEFLARYDAAISDLAATGAERAVVVSHGAAIRVWAAARCANLTREFLSRAHVPNTGVIRVIGSVHDGWQVESWDDLPLPPVAKTHL